MSGAGFTLEGSENLHRIFREYEENGYRKPIKAAFRKAGVPVKKAMIASLPSELKGLAKVIKVVTYKGDPPAVGVGPFGRGQIYVNSRGVKWNPFMLLYWHNYGTLANRDQGHSFFRRRNKRTASFQGGIKAGKFFERAWEQSKGQALTIFEKSYDEEVVKFLEKNAYK